MCVVIVLIRRPNYDLAGFVRSFVASCVIVWHCFWARRPLSYFTHWLLISLPDIVVVIVVVAIGGAIASGCGVQ